MPQPAKPKPRCADVIKPCCDILKQHRISSRKTMNSRFLVVQITTIR